MIPVIDFILNLAALLLWLTFRAHVFDPLAQTRPASLAGALKRTEPQRLRRWHIPVFLILLLFSRALLYWQIGGAVDWVPNLSLGAISIFFKSDVLVRMLVYSGLSFLVFLAIFYVWLLLFSLVNHSTLEAGTVQKWVQMQLGMVDRWPWLVKLMLPLVLVSAAWLAVGPLLTVMSLARLPASIGHRLEQAGIIALGVYLSWKYLIGGLLLLGLISNYVYLGEHPVWAFVNVTARNLCSPLRKLPLRIGKVDLTPVFAIVLVFLAAEQAERGLTVLYRLASTGKG